MCKCVCLYSYTNITSGEHKRPKNLFTVIDICKNTICLDHVSRKKKKYRGSFGHVDTFIHEYLLHPFQHIIIKKRSCLAAAENERQLDRG